MKFNEPVSRKLYNLGRLCLGVLSRRITYLEINRYFYPLMLIYEHNGQLSQQALAQLLEKDKSSIVTIIDQLSEKGYVKRIINPADRREHLISVTAKAERDIPAIISAFRQLNEDLTKDIPPAKMEIFYAVVDQMRANLQPYLKQERH